ncbi:MAG: acetyl-CoA carboxylase biotin carboxyl carrier protein [Planctomycetia bacterium]|nr:acetyl-CoA carboxylase biotin carboxyl carrier protein [Planctomycetia bacterium]
MNATPPAGDIFDVRRIRRLVELMNEYDLRELDLKQAEMRIRIRRGQDEVPVVETRPAVSTTAPAAAPGAAAAEAANNNLAIVKSPMVGTFYAASEPGKPPFVKAGDRVLPDTTVCLIEAMKVFNPIPAEVTGTIAAVLVKNEQPVEFNQPLFKVDTSA